MLLDGLADPLLGLLVGHPVARQQLLLPAQGQAGDRPADGKALEQELRPPAPHVLHVGGRSSGRLLELGHGAGRNGVAQAQDVALDITVVARGHRLIAAPPALALAHAREEYEQVRPPPPRYIGNWAAARRTSAVAPTFGKESVPTRLAEPAVSESNLVVRRYRDDDRSAVVAMLATAHEGWPVIEGVSEPVDPGAFFEWKHAASPFGPSRMLVAERDGEPVGFRAFMPWRLRAAGREVRAIRSADAITRPGLQRSGIFGQIRRAADELLAEPVDLYFGTPNSKSLGATRKLPGRSVVGALRISMQVRPLRMAAAVARGGGWAEPPAVQALGVPEALSGGGVDELLHDALDAEHATPDGQGPPLPSLALCRGSAQLHGGPGRKGRAPTGAGGLPPAPPPPVWEAASRSWSCDPATGRPRDACSPASRHHRRSRLSAAYSPPGTAARTAARARGFIPWRGSLPLMIKQPEPSVTPSPDRLAAWALGLGDVEIL